MLREQLTMSDGRLIDLTMKDGLPYISKQDFEMLKRARAQGHWKRVQDNLKALAARIRTVAELQAHRAAGHPTYSAQCPECRKANSRQRPHYRLDPSTRGGGELSVDVSGPHGPGRWPSDVVGDRKKVAKFWIAAAYQYFDEKELALKHQMEAVEMSLFGPWENCP